MKWKLYGILVIAAFLYISIQLLINYFELIYLPIVPQIIYAVAAYIMARYIYRIYNKSSLISLLVLPFLNEMFFYFIYSDSSYSFGLYTLNGIFFILCVLACIIKWKS